MLIILNRSGGFKVGRWFGWKGSHFWTQEYKLSRLLCSANFGSSVQLSCVYHSELQLALSACSLCPHPNGVKFERKCSSTEGA